ncbi:MAG: orotidine-5'-phosphate decarboxylase [Gammaproteobacteria bacterium]|nr:orotidine-5'-phosphate decarboxylase [Gammaproteobacteria bacterium]
MDSKANNPRIIVALDFSDAVQAEALAGRLDPARCRLKIGTELFTHAGPAMVRTLARRGFDVFLDLKFHDTPNTVGATCEVAASIGAWMINVHASGGSRMLKSARAAVDRASRPPLLVGVTVLTSLTLDDLVEIGIPHAPIAEQGRRLARLCKSCGLDGVVCSPQEAALLRAELGPDFLLVTPGIRPRGSAAGDQRRVTTPAEAVAAGSDYLVIGRPITQAPDPLRALAEIEAEIGPAGLAGSPAPARP